MNKLYYKDLLQIDIIIYSNFSPSLLLSPSFLPPSLLLVSSPLKWCPLLLSCLIHSITLSFPPSPLSGRLFLPSNDILYSLMMHIHSCISARTHTHTQTDIYLKIKSAYETKHGVSLSKSGLFCLT